ncbi:MAG: hypothetical protein KBD66_03030 [Candidatus Doudnabacteria bacterium]|nr:hypothetical protein [Candidatus Doudnabacteria bacterium]
MANEPQQLYDSEDELASRSPFSGRPMPGGDGRISGSPTVSGAASGGENETSLSTPGTEPTSVNSLDLGPSDSHTDIRESDAGTIIGRTRDAAADIAGGRAYRAGAERLGRDLGVDLPAQNERAGLKLSRESLANARESFAQGKVDRIGGGKSLREGVREQNKARLAKSATGSTGGGIAAGAGQQLGKEAVKDTAQTAAKAGAKAVPGLGAASAIDVQGLKNTAQDTARELANLHVGKAAKRLVTGLGKSAVLTVFRASYDPYVIGFTGSLSLIVTFLLGSVLFFVPQALLWYERLIVGMVWGLVLVVLCVILAVVVIITCSGLNVPGIVLKFAALFSTSAAAIDSVCTNASILSIVKGL